MSNYDSNWRGNAFETPTSGSLPSWSALAAIVSILIVGLAYDYQSHWRASADLTASRAAAIDSPSEGASSKYR